MKNVALYLSFALFALVAFSALRTIFDPRFPFVKKWENGARQAYLALTIAAVGLLAWAVFNGQLHIVSIEIGGVKATVGSLEKKVDTLSDQMKVFFSSKAIERFTARNWSQVRTVRKGTDVPFILEVTLKQKPLPGSIDVYEGVLRMPEFMYHISGRELQFPANGNTPKDELTITYYPDLTSSKSGSSQ